MVHVAAKNNKITEILISIQVTHFYQYRLLLTKRKLFAQAIFVELRSMLYSFAAPPLDTAH